MNYFYVICPVGADPGFSVKKAILEDIAHEHGLDPFFPLSRRRNQPVREALADIARAAFVLADLSFERPSCYFEVGLARAIGARLILVAAKGTPIHQVGDPSLEVRWYSGSNEYRRVISTVLATFREAVSA